MVTAGSLGGKTAFAGALDFYPMMGADDVSLFTVKGEAGAGACGISSTFGTCS